MLIEKVLSLGAVYSCYFRPPQSVTTRKVFIETEKEFVRYFNQFNLKDGEARHSRYLIIKLYFILLKFFNSHQKQVFLFKFMNDVNLDFSPIEDL